MGCPVISRSHQMVSSWGTGHFTGSKESCCEGTLFADLELLSLMIDIIPGQHKISSMDKVADDRRLELDGQQPSRFIQTTDVVTSKERQPQIIGMLELPGYDGSRRTFNQSPPELSDSNSAVPEDGIL